VKILKLEVCFSVLSVNNAWILASGRVLLIIVRMCSQIRLRMGIELYIV